MDTYYTRIHNGHIFARQIVAVVIAGILLSQPLIASDSWSRVWELKTKTWVYVGLSGGKYIEGALLRVDNSGMTVRSKNQEEVFLERDLVLQVAVDHKGRRHWYSIPLIILAAVAGGFAGNEIAKRTTCSDNPKDCRKAKGALIALPAIGSGGAAFYLTRGKSGRKVIYSKE